MKLHKGLFYVLLLVLLASCQKDQNQESDIAGTWELQEFNYQGTSVARVDGTESTTTFEGDARDITATIDFNTDGTYRAAGSYTIDLTYEFGGQSVALPVVINDFLGNGTYEVAGSTLTTKDNSLDESGTAQIVSLDEESMTISFPYTQKTVEQGIENELTLDGEYKLVKK